jgi:hypothetical protein
LRAGAEEHTRFDGVESALNVYLRLATGDIVKLMVDMNMLTHGLNEVLVERCVKNLHRLQGQECPWLFTFIH